MSTSTTDIKEVVKEKYGQTASRLTSGKGGCCGSGSALASSCDPITSKLYSAEESGTVPETTVLASLGCGNPTALAQLNPGEIVLDLGSGRRHRRPAVGAQSRAGRQCLRLGHDRRNAGPRA